jgi:hypothetical protein
MLEDTRSQDRGVAQVPSASEGTCTVKALTFDFQPPGPRDDTFLVFKPPSLCRSAIATLTR